MYLLLTLGPQLDETLFYLFSSLFIVILLSVILSAAINPAVIVLQKEIKLKKYFLLFVFPKLVSFILVIACVYYFRTYWALIIALLSEYLIRTVYSFMLLPAKVKFRIDKVQFKELYAFGGWLQLKNVTQWLAGNLDVAIVGNLLGTIQLGYYNRAQHLSQYPRTFVEGVINNVAFPLYSKITGDANHLNYVVNKIIDIVLLVLSLLAVIILLYAESIITIILGESWLEMSKPFKAIFIAYLMQTLLFSFNPLIRAYGFTKSEFKFYLIKIAVMIVLLYPFTYMWGLYGAGMAIMMAVLLVFPYLIHVLHNKTELRLLHFYISAFVCIVNVIVTIFVCDLIDFNTGCFFLVGVVISCAITISLFIVAYIFLNIGPGGVICEFISSLRK